MSIWTIIVVIILLGVLVTVHELGHFWIARLLRIKAFEVSIFVGPKLVDWRRNDVEYTIRALPFGAYVRFTDIDENGNAVISDDPDLLVNSPRWKRLIVALAGPFMNLLLGVIIFAILNLSTGFASLNVAGTLPGSQASSYIEEYDTPFDSEDRVIRVNGSRVFTYADFSYELDSGTKLTDTVTVTLKSHSDGSYYDISLIPEISQKPMIGIIHSDKIDSRYGGWEIFEVSEYQNEGNPVLKTGDFLIAVDGKSVSDDDFTEFMENLTEGDTMVLTYVRNGVTYEENCIKTMITSSNSRGIVLYSYEVKDFSSFLGAVRNAALMPLTICNLSVKLIGDVFEGEEEVYNMVSGPIGMTVAVSEVVDDADDSIADKVYNVIFIAGIISVGLMFSNMLPIPGLDGIQVILIIVEMIIGHPLSRKSENIINAVGFVMLICLVLFAFASDIIRIILE